MLNKVILIGRLTKTPEIKIISTGTQVASFTIAVNRKYKDKNGNWQEEVYFFETESFGKLAERVAQLDKGYQILIEGELRQDKWESAAGEKRSRVKIVANKISLLSKPADANNINKNSQTEDSSNIDFDDDDEEDIPF